MKLDFKNIGDYLRWTHPLYKEFYPIQDEETKNKFLKTYSVEIAELIRSEAIRLETNFLDIHRGNVNSAQIPRTRFGKAYNKNFQRNSCFMIKDKSDIELQELSFSQNKIELLRHKISHGQCDILDTNDILEMFMRRNKRIIVYLAGICGIIVISFIIFNIL